MDVYTTSWKNDPEFVNIYKKFDEIVNTNNSPNPIEDQIYSRLYILRQLAKQQKNKNKNFLECGVFAGMSMFFVADQCTQSFIGIDSFEGVSEPGEYDTDYFKTKKLKIEIQFAQNVLKDFSNVKLYKGWIPEVFNQIEKMEYSFIHIDVDLFEPTKNSIEYFWNSLVFGGVLVCDDFGSEKTIGARKAMIDFFGKDSLLELPTGQAIIYKTS